MDSKQLETLRELQKVDLAQEELRIDVDNRREIIEELKDKLRDAENELDDLSNELSEQRGELSKKQLVLEENQKGFEHANTKLNAATNSRDYAALEREVENFRKASLLMEEEIKKLDARIADLTVKVNSSQDEFDTLKTKVDSEESEVNALEASIETQVAELTAKSAELSKKVQPQILARYRFIRSKRTGPAVVSASTGICSGCHMKLQPQAFIILQRQKTLECCQNCQRIIYFDRAEHDAWQSEHKPKKAEHETKKSKSSSKKLEN